MRKSTPCFFRELIVKSECVILTFFAKQIFCNLMGLNMMQAYKEPVFYCPKMFPYYLLDLVSRA